MTWNFICRLRLTHQQNFYFEEQCKLGKEILKDSKSSLHNFQIGRDSNRGRRVGSLFKSLQHLIHWHAAVVAMLNVKVVD